MSEARKVHTVEHNGYAIRLDSPQAFYDAVDLLHTAALDGMQDVILAPVVEALVIALDRIGEVEGVHE